MATGQEINPTQPDIPHASTLNAQQAVLLFINTQNYYCGDSMLQQSLAVQQAQVRCSTAARHSMGLSSAAVLCLGPCTSVSLILMQQSPIALKDAEF